MIFGDTLSEIGARFGIPYTKLLEWNSITSHLIHPGQVLILEEPNGEKKTANETSTATTQTTLNKDTYTVQWGDTLSSIAKQHDTTIKDLMKLNSLYNHIILAGQTLKIRGELPTEAVKEEPKKEEKKKTSSNQVLDLAFSLVGTPYSWGGASPSGFDCSGFIYYVFTKSGYNLSRGSSLNYYNLSYGVSEPVPGDLVFFANTYKAGISHMGIYIGNNEFVHAGSSGIEITSLTNSYWNARFVSYNRFH
ncbi:C40 family peptidase [Bacillus coahuilensis]|uniref:C40 family peptidase n=1 Tax=Bacillus coahuilensis TaxID=408580 RepID=UPI0007517872|nr:C40 family peptidase [Bacillus coahuilensis]